jgi:hypothetical protein
LAIATGPQSPISQLPPELRENIYSNLLHEEHYEPCSKVLLGLDNAACLCGRRLSLTTRFFCNKLRRRTYKCMTFIFNKPIFADLILREIRKQEELGHFFENHISEYPCGFVST